MFLLIVCVALVHTTLAQVTCPGLGDFNPTPPFLGWPDPTCPNDPGLELTFTMFTTGNILGQDFDRNSIPGNFDSSMNTMFLVHGWTSDDQDPLLDNIKDTLVANEDWNVVIVGWGGPDGAGDINYFRSASDTRTVGAETAEVMINLIQNGGGSTSMMHIKGHSLGAQVTGHAGRWASGQGFRPARCTGFDPAGPFFINNTDRTVGIYNDCADFVDIIHTDQRYGSTPLLGSTDVFLGHQDFFPNGGIDQPGCDTDLCDHIRVVNLYDESITNGCFDAEQTCDDSGNIPDSCSSCLLACPRMGHFAAAGPEGRFTLTTGSFGNFCS